MANPPGVGHKNWFAGFHCNKKAIYGFLAAALCVQLAACAGPDRKVSTGVAQSPRPAASALISPKLQEVIEALRADGVTQDNAQQRNARAYSTPLVKVDDTAAIQVHVKVSGIDRSMLATLERMGMRIELHNEDLGLIQGWVPYERIDDAAALKFVERISPPDYAISG